ncbi:DUF433 domain-containing protein [Chryseosolibacter indicus]|uniref:DUF433 domain-containing protein n=1 Tax=Chryseosolibacter indicus TaxID=2782351 RepID=A0ABS5VVE8_9BACT|nr:DUF433 domain-containing protein [Chryseosolibacter indicus]MBT1705400.1 DUF433 domain-containing protein [Chryseosolibacter indicus]
MKYGAIEIDKEIMQGKPVFQGSGIPVQTLFEYLEDGKTITKFLDDFPAVNQKDVIEVLQMAKLIITTEKTLKENFSEQ